MRIASKLSFKRQLSLLTKCISKEFNLHTELDNLGLVYDDLRYKNNGPIVHSSTKYLTLDSLLCDHHEVPIVSFFLVRVVLTLVLNMQVLNI